MLTHHRPTFSPDLVSALARTAPTDSARTQLVSLLSAALLTAGNPWTPEGVQVEVHAGRLYLLSTDGMAAILLSASADLPNGSCWLPAAAVKLYRQTRGYSPLVGTVMPQGVHDLRQILSPTHTAPASVQRWSPRLLALPERVLAALKLKGRHYYRADLSGAEGPVRLSLFVEDLRIMIIMMPARLDP